VWLAGQRGWSFRSAWSVIYITPPTLMQALALRRQTTDVIVAVDLTGDCVTTRESALFLGCDITGVLFYWLPEIKSKEILLLARNKSVNHKSTQCNMTTG